MAKKEHYAFIPESTLISDKFKSLRPHARLLYIYMAWKRHGIDEPFTYSYKEIRKDTGYKFDTIARSIRQLAAVGFIEYKHGGLEVNKNIYYMVLAWLER